MGSTPTPALKTLTEEEFDASFTEVLDPDQNPVHDTMPTDPDSRHLWTIVEGDAGGDLYAAPGAHVVNRLGYLLTEQPWSDDIACAEWDIRSH